MQLTEAGIDPTPGGEVDMDVDKAVDGIDTILEFAIKALNRAAAEKRSVGESL